MDAGAPELIQSLSLQRTDCTRTGRPLGDIRGDWRVHDTTMSGGIKSPVVISKLKDGRYKLKFQGDTYHSGAYRMLTGAFDGTTYSGALSVKEATVTAAGSFALSYQRSEDTETLWGAVHWTNDYDHVTRSADVVFDRPVN